MSGAMNSENMLEVAAVLEEKSRKYQIQKLQDNHREILRLAAIGHKPGEIAQMMGMTQLMISNVLGSELGKAHLNELHETRDDIFLKTAKELEDLLPKATAVFHEILSKEVATNPMQRHRVAESLLDRVGFGKHTKVEQTSTNTSLDLTELARIREKAKERRAAESVNVSKALGEAAG